MPDKPTHLDDSGRAQMVDVSAKAVTERAASARAFVYLARETFDSLRAGDAPKGDVVATAKLAGIMAAKRTGELIPLCHPISLTHVEVRFAWIEDHAALAIDATARCRGRTGVEMEAITAASVAALTVYDMTKGIDRSVTIGDVHVWSKEGGKSGSWRHPAPPGPLLDGADWS